MSVSDLTTYKRWPQFLAVGTSLLAVFCCQISSEWYHFYLLMEEPMYTIMLDFVGPVAAILGTILFSPLMDTIGRKKTIFLIGVLQLISMSMIYLMYLLPQYLSFLIFIGRFITGLSEGGWLTVLPIYISEISEPRIRGFLGSSFSLILTIGIIFGSVFGATLIKTSIYISPIIFFICMLVFVVVFSLMPESPYFLVMKNRNDEAYSNLKKLRYSQNVNEELTSLVEVVQRQMEDKGTFKELWTIKSTRKNLLIMILLRIFESFIDSVLYWRLIDLNIEHFKSMCFISLVRIVFTLISTLLVDIIGRRRLLLFSVGSCSITLCLISLCIWFTKISSTMLLYGLWGFVIASFSIGLGTVVNLLLGELFPVRVKAKASCLINIVFVGGWTGSYYVLTWGEFDWTKSYFVFGIIQLVGLVFFIKYLPETKKKTLGEIQQELKWSLFFNNSSDVMITLKIDNNKEVEE